MFDWIPCHRSPERCFHIHGKPMSLCARCTAIYAGYLFAPIFLLFHLIIPLYVSILLCIPLVIDGYTQKWKWRTSTNTLRFLTGLAFGIGQSLFISTLAWKIGEWL